MKNNIKNNENTQFIKGKSGNLNGRPKGKKTKRVCLKNLIFDIAKIKDKNGLSSSQLAIIYQLYQVALSDYTCDVVTTTIQHLYFIESDFGIKIGISKDVNERLRQIKNYAPSARILKVIPYAGNFESKLHAKFKKQNIKNSPLYGIEWFYKNDDLIAFIESIDNVKDLCNIFGSDKIGQLQFDF
jgi:hypothetical protein